MAVVVVVVAVVVVVVEEGVRERLREKGCEGLGRVKEG